MRKLNKTKIVFIGLSGGVDSSVSAALLKKAGFDVRGVFIKVWQPNFWGGCTMKNDRLDAMRICARLNIPFYTLNLEKEYKKEVVDYMINEYKKGKTPNPDVMCNKYIKFGGFFDWAIKNGANYVATGHYARIQKLSKNRYQLKTGYDNNKDQSYFLWTLTQKQLSKTLFPIGNLIKPQVRKLAKKYGLQTAEKKDSQGLCFIGKVEMADFLKHFIKTRPGRVLNEKGNIIGVHQGASLYTVGQRHGFTITSGLCNGKRNFITEKNISNNTITVSDKIIKNNYRSKKETTLYNVNWTLDYPPNESDRYQARIRYRGALDDCRIQILKENKCKVLFTKEQKAPAPGQSVVIYDNEICLGGGIIE